VALRHELRQKGIADDIIANALQVVDAESNAYRAAETQARRLAGLDARTFRKKLGSFLLRRGFSHDIVWPVVARLWQEQRAGSDDLDESG
jgi:regulatory protein